MGFKSSFPQVSQPRRRFVQGLIAGGVIAAFPSVLQARSSLGAGTLAGSAPELSGKVIELVIDESPVNFTGAVRMARHYFTLSNGRCPWY